MQQSQSIRERAKTHDSTEKPSLWKNKIKKPKNLVKKDESGQFFEQKYS